MLAFLENCKKSLEEKMKTRREMISAHFHGDDAITSLEYTASCNETSEKIQFLLKMVNTLRVDSGYAIVTLEKLNGLERRLKRHGSILLEKCYTAESTDKLDKIQREVGKIEGELNSLRTQLQLQASISKTLNSDKMYDVNCSVADVHCSFSMSRKKRGVSRNITKNR